MSEEALNSASARLERAVARLERAHHAREAAGNGIAEAFASLQARHGALRSRVQETITRLDTLIDGEAAR